MDWTWEDISPHYDDLQSRNLTRVSIKKWLDDWGQLKAFIQEAYARIDTAFYINADAEKAQARRQTYFREICQPAWKIDQKLENRWAVSGLAVPGYENQLANLIRSKTKNIPENTALESEENELNGQYLQIYFGSIFSWDGNEISKSNFKNHMRTSNREVRKQLWHQWNTFLFEQRENIENIWRRMIEIRHQIAQNAGVETYLDYRWHQDNRDYPIEAYRELQESVARTVVPAATKIYKKYCKNLEINTLRPWDFLSNFSFDNPAPPLGTSGLEPFQTIEELTTGVSRIFHRLDPKLGEYFDILNNEGYLDLEPHPGKNSGGSSRAFALSRRSFISMSATGTHEDVWILIHEVGHAFGVFETANRSIIQLSTGYHNGGGEWAEFASQTMEFLTLPYMDASQGGFYNDRDAALAKIDRQEDALLYLPHIALLDNFEHWIYMHPNEGKNPEQCRLKWRELWKKYIPGVDWTGQEYELENSWIFNPYLFAMPLYYASYGISLLGSLQLWQRAQKDQAGAVAAYRHGLAQGGQGLQIPELFKAAGVQIDFSTGALQKIVNFLETQIAALEST